MGSSSFQILDVQYSIRTCYGTASLEDDQRYDLIAYLKQL